MKRFFISKQKNKRKKLETEALNSLRKTRAKFQEDHPGLLSKIRLLHEKMQDQQKSRPQQVKSGDVPIDRAKNMETVARFLQITNSEAIKKSLRDKTF